MKTLKKLLIILVVVLSIYSCSNTNPVDPAFKVLNNMDSTVWVCLGTFDEANKSYEAVSNWVKVDAGQSSEYISFLAGSYFVCYDWDSDHSSIKEPLYEKLYSNNQTYTLHFKADNNLSIE